MTTYASELRRAMQLVAELNEYAMQHPDAFNQTETRPIRTSVTEAATRLAFAVRQLDLLSATAGRAFDGDPAETGGSSDA